MMHRSNFSLQVKKLRCSDRQEVALVSWSEDTNWLNDQLVLLRGLPADFQFELVWSCGSHMAHFSERDEIRTEEALKCDDSLTKCGFRSFLNVIEPPQFSITVWWSVSAAQQSQKCALHLENYRLWAVKSALPVTCREFSRHTAAIESKLLINAEAFRINIMKLFVVK